MPSAEDCYGPQPHPYYTGPRLQPATCKCGHKGESKRPEFYKCGYCYYMGEAKGNDRRVIKLRAKIEKLRKEAKKFRKKATKFRARHPLPKRKKK